MKHSTDYQERINTSCRFYSFLHSHSLVFPPGLVLFGIQHHNTSSDWHCSSCHDQRGQQDQNPVRILFGNRVMKRWSGGDTHTNRVRERRGEGMNEYMQRQALCRLSVTCMGFWDTLIEMPPNALFWWVTRSFREPTETPQPQTSPIATDHKGTNPTGKKNGKTGNKNLCNTPFVRPFFRDSVDCRHGERTVSPAQQERQEDSVLSVPRRTRTTKTTWVKANSDGGNSCHLGCRVGHSRFRPCPSRVGRATDTAECGRCCCDNRQ